jgi:hypothetical protein
MNKNKFLFLFFQNKKKKHKIFYQKNNKNTFILVFENKSLLRALKPFV